MKKTLKGGCQCGKVKFTVQMTHNEAYYCHCRMCQKAFGNIFATFTNVKKENVKWESAPPDYFHSSKIAKRGFCSKCGTPLTFEFPDSPNMDFAVGCFDDPNFFELTSHSGYEGKVHWFPEDKLPKERTTDNEKVMQRWKDAYGPKVVPGSQ